MFRGKSVKVARKRRETLWSKLLRVGVTIVTLVVLAGFVENEATREALVGPRRWGIFIAAVIASVLAARWVLTRPGQVEQGEPERTVEFEHAGFGEFEPMSPLGSAATRTAGFGEPYEPPLDTWSLDTLRRIEWRRLEAVVEGHYQARGYPTRTQTHGADGGVDIWICSKEHPDLPAAIVQCKHWPDRMVGVNVVRELLGTMTANKVKAGEVVTSGSFSREAEAFAARGLPIELIDGRKLVERIRSLSESEQEALLKVAFEGDYWRPTCASCGVKMKWRPQGFWGCRNYPRCKNKLFPRAGSIA